MAGFPIPPKQYADIECNRPHNLGGRKLLTLDDKETICTEDELKNIPEFTHEYEVLPNLRFRDIL
jgi:hypothetical protein